MEKATEAREKNEQGTELDAIKLAVVNSVASGLDGFVDTTALKSGLNGLIQENPEDVITGDGPWVVTSALGRVYEINKNSIVNELTGLVLTPKSLTLTIEGNTYEEKTINARLIDIEGTLTWSDSTDIIDVTSSADGKSATIKAKKSGTETITVSCSNGDVSECTVTVNNTKNLNIGDNIQYNVSYTDIYNSTEYSATNGWRVLDTGAKNGNTYTGVKIISTKLPATLRYKSNNKNNNTWWDSTLENTGVAYAAASGLASDALFKNISFNGDDTNTTTGWNKGNYNSITVAIEDQSTEWSSNTGAIFLTNKAIGVHNLTLDELNKAEGHKTIGNNNTDYPPSNHDVHRLFTLGTPYWLSSPYSNQNLFFVSGIGTYSNYDGYKYSYGIRPVITLKPVTLTWNSTDSYWEVE